MLLFINIGVLAINDYDHKFIEYYGNASITDAISAIRGSSSSEINNVGVISKNNQPVQEEQIHTEVLIFIRQNTRMYIQCYLVLFIL